jgi:acyl transferase domain-containing protein
LAVVNGPQQTVIAALTADLDRLSKVLDQHGWITERIPTTHGFHSRLVEPMLDDFEEFASTIAMRSSVLPMVSTQTGAIVSDEVATTGYWRGNLRNPVRFD